jgi:hypothetical protein
MMDIFSPTSAFIRVDLPALGLPIMLTKPALCAIEKKYCYLFGLQRNELYLCSPIKQETIRLFCYWKAYFGVMNQQKNKQNSAGWSSW